MKKYKKDYPEYKNYLSMIRNCSSKEYNTYTINNIQICSQWLGKNGFWIFLKDMGEKPSKKHKLFRKDLRKNYFKDNCFWSITKKRKIKEKKERKLQRNNFNYQGKSYNIASFSKKFNLPYKRTYSRIIAGWDLYDVINEPNQHQYPTRSYLNKFHPNYWIYKKLVEKNDTEKIKEFFKRLKSKYI